jgi:membrane protein DedA with SNARE-associated domain
VKPTPGRPEWVEQVFARHFFSVSRVLEALVAGTSRMHWGTFVFYSVLGGTIWATAVVLEGNSGLLRPGLGQYAALVPTVSPLLVLLLGAASSS